MENVCLKVTMFLLCVQNGINDLHCRSLFDDEQNVSRHRPLSAAMSQLQTVVPSSHWRPSSIESTGASSLLRSATRDADHQRSRFTAVGSRYKTELCRAFAEHGSCRYADKCQFAHGRDDLRTVARHPKYKTDLCRTYHTTGLCPYGPRCHFIHNEDYAVARVAKQRAGGASTTQRELELRLAMLNLCRQQNAAASQAPAASCTTAAYQPDRPHPTAFQFSPLTAVRSFGVDSVGTSPSSSAVDDDSPPPLSPTVDTDDTYRQLVDTDERLTSLYVLAARLRLLHCIATNR